MNLTRLPDHLIADNPDLAELLQANGRQVERKAAVKPERQHRPIPDGPISMNMARECHLLTCPAHGRTGIGSVTNWTRQGHVVRVRFGCGCVEERLLR